jgi:hypothetical protein
MAVEDKIREIIIEQLGVATEEVVPEAREEVDALRTWLQVLGGSWTESRGDDESITRLSLPRSGR